MSVRSFKYWARKPNAYRTVLYTVAMIHFHPLESPIRMGDAGRLRVMRWSLKVHVHLRLPTEKQLSSSANGDMRDARV